MRIFRSLLSTRCPHPLPLSRKRERGVFKQLLAWSRRRSAICSRRGAIIVLAAVSTVILAVGAAFSVDIAYIFLARAELHVATDAAAKAAVIGLAQGNSQTNAINAAIACAGANRVCGQPLAITSSNVVLGNVTYSQTGYWTFTPGGATKTAAQVSVQTSLPLLFARLFGSNTSQPQMTSTAAFVRNKICLVFDRSGSMCFDMSGVNYSYPPPGTYPSAYYQPPNPVGSRWAALSTASETLLGCLASSAVQNKVALVTFSSSSSTDCSFTSSYSSITNDLDDYGANQMIGGTNMYSGLQRARNLFTNDTDQTPWNRVIILFSDGQWNEGSNPLNLVTSLKNAGIVVHAVGLLGGGNSTMEQLAEQTGGSYYHATTSSELQAAFTVLAQTIPVILTQ